jgi:hypothetical protein
MDGWGQLTGGALVGMGAGLAPRATGGNCFVAGTPVLMADGSSKAIEEVKAGDKVLSKDEVSGKIVAKEVVNTKVRTAPSTLVIEVAGGTRVETTPEHPFYVEGTGWTPAGRLAIGNAIVTRAGPSLKIVRIETKEKPATVYNFEVEGTHSYFVGNPASMGSAQEKVRTGQNYSWLWVHNYVDPYEIKFSQDSIKSTFNEGDWQGHSLTEAIEATRKLGKLPEGLTLRVMEVNGELVTLNNRTLYVAQEANLSGVKVDNVGPSGWNTLWKLMKDIGGPLPYGTQPRIR